MKKNFKWIIWFPTIFIIAAILQLLPIFAYQIARNWDIQITFWNICFGVAVGVPMIIFAASLWAWAVINTPMWTCNKIAPNNKVASVIFGTLFILFQAQTFISMAQKGYGFWAFVYGGIFSLLLVYGTVAAYQVESDEEE
ncbi:MAG: hypothetical protein GX126_07090 [Bacteroidales bacterium]|jgi:hypothetical protein|nr:hypothetical protein [Bacteroidales bacterium]